MDAILDDRLGEQVRFEPWQSGAYTDGAPDAARPVITAVGVHLTYVPVSSEMRGTIERSADFMSRMTTSDVRISVLESYFTSGGIPRKGDHVSLLDRDEHFTVETAVPDATGRVMIHLIRRNETT